MRDVQDGLGIKNISEFVRKEIQDIYESRQKSKLKSIKNLKLNWIKKNMQAL